ncbi:hypothetical protein WA026_021330 [Henosepilachna vigintioctopunctata]|uniref:Chromo domain-containing protein n=1 Tax=Henosepilachna vigintioctopunctata TaxID=420089 RepID=A0AAW1UE26_9CUCU
MTKAKNISEGISITTTTKDDFRALTKMLDHAKYEYHTYQLEEEKNLNKVIDGISCEMNEEGVEQDLISEGYQPIKITRPTRSNRISKNPMAMILRRREKTYSVYIRWIHPSNESWNEYRPIPKRTYYRDIKEESRNDERSSHSEEQNEQDTTGYGKQRQTKTRHVGTPEENSEKWKIEWQPCRNEESEQI